MRDIPVLLNAIKRNRASIATSTLIVASIAIFAASNRSLSDTAKFEAFEIACRTATETIYSGREADAVALNYQPWSGVIEDHYYPTIVAENLLNKDKGVRTVQLLFEIDERHTVLKSCVGTYVLTAAQPRQVKIPACGQMVPVSSVPISNIRLVYEYGPINAQAIRTFKFLIVDLETHTVLAEQKSYQLLLGGMKRPKNRSLLAYGTAQGAKVCKLTSPVDFILKVLDGNG